MDTVTGRNPYKICTYVGLAMLVKTLMSAVTSSIVIPLLHGAGVNSSDNIWIRLGVSGLMIYSLALPIFLITMRFIPDGPDAPPADQHFGPGKFIAWLTLAIGGGMLINLVTAPVINVVQSLFTDVNANNVGVVLSEIPGKYPALANFLLGACVAGFFEEFIYRYMLRKKMRGCSDLSYMLMSGLLFSLMHTNFSQFSAAFFIGIFFAWVYVQTNSFLIIAVLHTLVDTVSLVIIPALPEGIAGIGMLVYMVGTTIAALALIIIFFQYFKKSLRGAIEPGWSDRQPLRDTVGSIGVNHVKPSAASKVFTPITAKGHGAFYTCVLNPGVLLFIIATLLITITGGK